MDIESVIRDDGQGMNAEELDRIIKPFYMVDKSRARSGGAGLGLAICEEILALHGFEMKFESKEKSERRWPSL